MIDWLSGLASNQVFSGVAGASLVGGVMFWLRDLPVRAWNTARELLTFRIEVSNDSVAFPAIIVWLSGQVGSSWHHRNFKLLTDKDPSMTGANWITPDEANGKNEWTLAPGAGKHLLWFERRPVIVEREASNEKHTSGVYVREIVRIRLCSHDRERMNRLLESLKLGKANNGKLPIFSWDERGCWNLIDRRRARPLDSVILGVGMIEGIVDDVTRFLGAEAWYADRGIPYRRGYLFCGPPGTGKTSAAMAIAGHLGLPLYALNYGSCKTDESLINAVTSVPAGAVLLIEDFDRSGSGPSLSSLLNAIDGPMARDGRILILTANDPDQIQDVVLRPGRIDKRVEFGLAGPDEISRMFERFFPSHTGVTPDKTVPRPAAEVQGILIEAGDDPVVAARRLRE